MTRAKKKKKSKPQPTPSSTTQTGPAWVARMHEYHSRTGLYRAEDLDRVLGDPREQVSGQPCDDFAIACRISSKE